MAPKHGQHDDFRAAQAPVRRLRRRRILALLALLAMLAAAPVALPACQGGIWEVQGSGKAGSAPPPSAPSDP